MIDLETTGLKAASDAIIEYGALRVRDGVPVEELTMLVCGVEKVPAEITALTGLSAAELQQGTEPREALQRFLTFLGKDPLVGHNIAFDLEFLRMACKQYGFPILTNRRTLHSSPAESFQGSQTISWQRWRSIFSWQKRWSIALCRIAA